MKKRIFGIVTCLCPLLLFGQQHTALDPQALKEGNTLWESFNNQPVIMPAGWGDFPIVVLSENHQVDVHDKKVFNPIRLFFHARNEHVTDIRITSHYLIKINDDNQKSPFFGIPAIRHIEENDTLANYTAAVRFFKSGALASTDMYIYQGKTPPDSMELPPLNSGDMVEYVIECKKRTNEAISFLFIPPRAKFPIVHYTYDAHVDKKLRTRVYTSEDLSPYVDEGKKTLSIRLSKEHITDTIKPHIRMTAINVNECRYIGIKTNSGLAVNHTLYGYPDIRRLYKDILLERPLKTLYKDYGIPPSALTLDPSLSPSEKAKKIALYCRDLTDLNILTRHGELLLMVGLLKENNIAFQMAYTNRNYENALEEADRDGKLWFVRIDADGTCLFPLDYPHYPKFVETRSDDSLYYPDNNYVRADQVPTIYVGKRAVTEDHTTYFTIQPNP